MGSGGKGGSSTSFDRSQIPPGFRTNLKRFGQSTGGVFRDPRMRGITDQTLDFYSNLQDSPYITEPANAALRMVQDPTSLTDPLFLQQRERLGAELIERGRQTGGAGGLYSTGTNNLLSQGLGDFTNRYLSDAYGRQLAAGSALTQQRFGLGQALFTPFQAYSQPYMSLLGRGQQPGQFNNSKGQLWNTIGQAVGTSSSIYAASASDSRLKRAIRTIGRLGPLRLVAWKWKDGRDAPTAGFIAQEVQRVWPDAVVTMPGGFLAVRYGLVLARLGVR